MGETSQNFALYESGRTHIPILSGRADLYTAEKHTFAAKATQNLVESGVTMTDHVVMLPHRLELTGWLSDLEQTNTNRVIRGAETWQHLLSTMEEKTLLTVQTPIFEYKNMIITKAIAPFHKGRTLKFTLELMQIKMAQTHEGSRDSASTQTRDNSIQERITPPVSRGVIPSPTTNI